MNHGYKPTNGHSKALNQAVFTNPQQALLQRATGKIKLSQTYLVNETISNELLKPISIYEEREFFDAMEVVHLERCETISKPEDPIRHLYFPESAVVSEFQILENGKTVEISMTGREGVVGINAAFNARQTQNFSQVLIPGKAFRVSLQSFKGRLDNCNLFQKSIYKYVNQHISQISQRVVCNSQHSTEERLCLWLLMITERCGKTVLPLTQEQIARFLGVHRPSVTLVTQNLRSEGVIDYLRGKVSITDRQKLKSRACTCYAAMARS